MAFDGSVVCAITDELNKKASGGRIIKVSQPEKDELLLTLKNNGDTHRLLISVNPSLPLIYFTDKNIPSPLTAPSFCMLLRKHIAGGRMIRAYQPDFERIINLEIEHYNEMGDLSVKTLVIELMGKHSNIILLEDNKILDSIRHIPSSISSVREVLPGRDYFIPFTGQKLDPLKTTKEDFFENVFKENLPLSKAIYMNYSGLSPDISEEIIYRAGMDSSITAKSFNDEEKEKIFFSFNDLMSLINDNNFIFNMVYEEDEPVFYGMFPYKIYSDLKSREYLSPSELIKDFYEQKKIFTEIRQKSRDLRQVISGLLAKDNKKYDLQLKQLKDTEKKDKFRLYGELLTAYGYESGPGASFMNAIDYNSGKEIKIPLDETLSAIENGKKYFDRYAKLKRTYEALSEIALDTKLEIEHLESIASALDLATNETEINEIKNEMIDFGYIKKKDRGNKKNKAREENSHPLHYISKDGFDIYVGKNNYQNEQVTFKIASSDDWWFHAKNMPGSHVIIRSEAKDIPDTTFMDAARLAAHYSKANSKDNRSSGISVEIDYTQRKFLKKTPGGKPGFVIYHTNYSMHASADIADIKQII